MQKRLEAAITELESYLIQVRRYLHENPEPSLKEFETSRYIKETLDQFGIPYQSVGETGVLATIKGSKPGGKTILLRADIDALEIDEQTQAPYASKKPGLMHACGHDAHTAMGLGTAKILNDFKDEFSGTIKIAFQQAEEIGAGAKQFVKSGLIDDIDESFAIHVKSSEPVGSISVRGGAVNASCDIFTIKVNGKSAHVGQPHLGRDALVAASEIVVALQTIVAREISPVDNAVVGVGKLEAGTRYNIVATEAKLEGTIRAFSHETRAHLKEAVNRIAKHIGEAHRCEVSYEWYDAAAPVINDLALGQRAAEIARAIPGIETVVTDYDKSMGADDYADYMINKPGVYALLGTQSSEKTAYGHHHEKFDIDEAALKLGVLYEVNYLLDRAQN